MFQYPKPSSEVAVVIPTYREFLSQSERLSLQRCLDILGLHPIVFVAPEGLDLAPEVRAAQKNGARVFRFNVRYFRGIEGYNQLLLSQTFFERFLTFRYILIHQLDVLVFADELLDWCGRGFDYIGPPWPENDPAIIWAAKRCSLPRRALASIRILPKSRVGNGGFTLRNVRAALNSLRILSLGVRLWSGNEDIFWSFYVKSYLPWFKLPDTRTALAFGFEKDPERCFEMNGRRLPFGCHKWEVHGPAFWHRVLTRPDDGVAIAMEFEGRVADGTTDFTSSLKSPNVVSTK
jgi:hypothetical protein